MGVGGWGDWQESRGKGVDVVIGLVRFEAERVLSRLLKYSRPEMLAV